MNKSINKALFCIVIVVSALGLTYMFLGLGVTYRYEYSIHDELNISLINTLWTIHSVFHHLTVGILLFNIILYIFSYKKLLYTLLLPTIGVQTLYVISFFFALSRYPIIIDNTRIISTTDTTIASIKTNPFILAGISIIIATLITLIFNRNKHSLRNMK